MHSDNFDFNLLLVFDAIFREGSVTKAAQGLGLSQGAMSHALNRLRAYFEDPLFVKIGNRMEPTRKAESIKNSVAEVVATVRNQILSSARFTPLQAKRVFTLCVTDMGELVFLPPLIERLKRLAPHCSLRTLQMPVEMIEGLLASGEADLAVGSIRSAPEGLYQQRLYLHTFVTMASVKNKQLGDSISREQFESMRHIVVSITGRSGESYDRVLEEQGILRQIAVTTPHFLLVPLLMDKHPDLIATVPLELAKVHAQLGIVRTFEPPVAVPPFQISQYWHSRFHHDSAVIWMRELMKSTFERYPEIVT